MEDANNRSYGFGEFRVDGRRRILYKNNETVSLTPRNFDLLIVLLENEGKIVSHDDLLDRVWEGTFVEQANLKNAVSVLRRILGEGPSEGTYIRTVPRRGYSFVAPVQMIGDLPADDQYSYTVTEQEIVVEEVWEDDDAIATPPIAAAHVLPSETVQAEATVRPRKRGKVLIIAASLIAFLTVGGFGVRQYLSSSNGLVYSADNITISKLTTEGNIIGGSVSISSNGKYIVYIAVRPEGMSLWTRQVATGIARQISQVMQGSIYGCVLTPDEDFIYYIFQNHSDRSKSGLYKISTFGGSPQKISDDVAGAITIAPDGKRLALARLTSERTTNIETMNLDGSDVKVVWSDPTDVRIWGAKYSVDGSTILFAIRKQLPDKMIYYVAEIPVAGGRETIILPEQEKQIADAVWMPDRKSLLVSIRELNAEVRQVWQYFIAAREWKRVTNDNASYRGLSLTADGRTLVASQDSRATTLWASPTGAASDLVQVLPGTHYLIDVSWTTDARIVYSGIENSREIIGILNADGTGNRQLTPGEDGIWLFPAASRDGKHIAFVSNRSGRRQLWTMETDGRGARQVSQFETDMYDGRLLSDGVTTIMTQLGSPNGATLVLRQSDGSVRTIAENYVSRWALSPDEKMVAVLAENPATQKREVRIVVIETGEVLKTLSIDAKRVMRWTPDGKALAHDVVDASGGKIMLQPIDGGEEQLFLSIPTEEFFGFDWSFDHKHFAVARGKHQSDVVQISVNSGR